MDKKRKEIIAGNEISEIRVYNLCGKEQKVMIEGKSKHLPVVLFLHGGPGSPIPFNEGMRGTFPQITEKIIAVFWDQYGCGINDAPVGGDMTVESYVDMTVELVKALKKDFSQNQLDLFGVSWGSVLAAKTAERVPELTHKVAVYGQIIKELIFNDIVHDKLAKSSIPKIKLRKYEEGLKREERSSADIREAMGYIAKFTNGRHNEEGGKAPVREIIKSILSSPDYSFKNFKAIMNNGMTRNQNILSEIIKLDLTETLKNIKVPYLILQGDTDIITPTATVKEFMRTAQNDNLYFEEIDKSGHMPGLYGMQKLIEKLLAFASE